MLVAPTKTAQRPFVRVYPRDGALDLEHPDFDMGLWIETGDPKYLPMRVGMLPTYFHLRHLRQYDYLYLRQFAGNHEEDDLALMVAAFRIAVVKVENWEGAVRHVVLEPEKIQALSLDTLNDFCSIDYYAAVKTIGAYAVEPLLRPFVREQSRGSTSSPGSPTTPTSTSHTTADDASNASMSTPASNGAADG